MTKTFPHRYVAVTLASALPVALACHPAQAGPAQGKTLVASLPAERGVALALPPAPPDFVPMSEIKKQWAKNQKDRLPVLLPTFGGETIKQPMHGLLTDPELDGTVAAPEGTGKVKATLVAQVSPAKRPRVLPPAPIPVKRPPAPVPQTPKWVRYPLEFQLCGIALGTKAVDKDKYNRIDRYGLFAMHGNPTAVVIPAAVAGGIAISQQPPEVAAMFPANEGGGLPDWASAITVALDNNHVEWLYRRDTYSMGFIVDRLGYVDAIVVAGVQSPIAKTQLEDPLHTIQLGDDLRKVLFRYGYPDTMETYVINPVAAVGTTVGEGATGAGAAGGAEGAAGAGAAAPGAGAAGGAAAPGAAGAAAPAAGAGTVAFRTFEVRYEQSYNVVFTIRNNRVVRMYIFGDPDFFNRQRRERMRSSY